ncbi:MAG: Xaa-Pro peptidase family protein [Thermodesulfobacteriota bacterium]
MNHSVNHTPEDEINGRLKELQRFLMRQEIDGALILQNTDLFYFSGTIQQAHLFVPASGEPVLLVRKSLERARTESAVAAILPITSSRQIPDLLREKGHCLTNRIGLELDVLPTNLYFYYQQLFPKAELTDIADAVRMMRSVKSPYEIGLMREAARLSDQVAGHVGEVLCEGITEIELAGKVEACARKLGHQGIIRMRMWGNEMFYGHLMSGPAAAVPSYMASPTGGAGISPAVAQGPGQRRIRPYEPVLIDYVFAHQGYLSDHTRIFALKGLPDDLLAAHAAMLDLQALLKKMAKPGVAAGDIYRAALDRVDQLGYADHFMGCGDQRIRFVGHGIGLELDEYPFLAEGQQLQLQEGMTVALEPKLVFPGKGVVGIENTHVVTAKGLEQLTRFEEGVIVL